MIGAVLAIAAVVANYSCVLDPPHSLVEEGGVKLQSITLPQVFKDDWRFNATVERGANDFTMQIDWPKDPIQIAGNHPALQTADGAYAAMAVQGGGCMFTEKACLTVVHLVDTPNGTKVMIQPTALATDSEKHTREPFTVIIEGRCTRSGVAK